MLLNRAVLVGRATVQMRLSILVAYPHRWAHPGIWRYENRDMHLVKILVKSPQDQ